MQILPKGRLSNAVASQHQTPQYFYFFFSPHWLKIMTASALPGTFTEPIKKMKAERDAQL